MLLSSNLEDYLGQGKARDTGLDPQMCAYVIVIMCTHVSVCVFVLHSLDMG